MAYVVLGADNCTTNITISKIYGDKAAVEAAIADRMSQLKGGGLEPKEVNKSGSGFSILSNNGDLQYAQIASLRSPDGRTLGKMAADSMSNYGFDNKGYAEVISREHPTIQQSWMRATVETLRQIVAVADARGYNDPRNKETVEAAKKMIAVIDDISFPML